MEKFSAFRDPATGIQPFLPLVPPLDRGPIALFLIPIRSVLATLRTLSVAVIALLYCVLEYGLYVPIIPIPSLWRSLSRLSTLLLTRLVLCILGFVRIQEEFVAKRRGDNLWRPQAGDIIVSNWTSWVDVLWITYRFNPVFVMPVISEHKCRTSSMDALPTSHKPGRNKRFPSPIVPAPAWKMDSRSTIRGFRQVSLLEMILISGRTPEGLPSNTVSSLEEVRQSTSQPIVVFPECTTSNGRGILRFANVFEGFSVPTKKFNVFIMCIRHDPPTSWRPSPSYPIASPLLSPFQHLFMLSKSMSLHHMTVRMLPLSESPSSHLFKVSEVVLDSPTDLLAEVCAALMARIGKAKRLSFGWEEKIAFLELYRNRWR